MPLIFRRNVVLENRTERLLPDFSYMGYRDAIYIALYMIGEENGGNPNHSWNIPLDIKHIDVENMCEKSFYKYLIIKQLLCQKGINKHREDRRLNLNVVGMETTLQQSRKKSH